MIGLGSNRLTVCRRGGMSVTQAGRGGMEWLGSRGPSWASPYSVQATAALKDAFTAAQWQTIKAYGFAHPEIVGYMNAYAPEDAKIAYSLVPTLNVVRLLMGDGRAYINTGKSLADGFRAKFKLYFNDNGRNAGFVGTHGTSSPWKRNFIGCGDGNKAEVAYGDNYPYGNNTFTVGTIYDIDASTAKVGTYFKVDGDYAISERTHSQALSEITVKLFAMGYNLGSGSNESKSGMDGIELFGADNTTRIAYYVTFIRNGVNGMLDLLTGDFFPNANSSGSFTISETPAS